MINQKDNRRVHIVYLVLSSTRFNISNSNNLNKFWVGIFTRQGHINKVNLTGESWLVSDNDSQWSDSGPIKRMKWKNVWKKFATYLWAFTSLVWLPPSILTVNVTPWSKKSCPQGTSWKKMKTLILCTFETYFWTIRRKRRRKISWKASVEFQFCDVQDWDQDSQNVDKEQDTVNYEKETWVALLHIN